MGDPMKGGYLLLLHISSQCTINTHKRKFILPPGVYAYAGSALGVGGIEARIRRHLRVFRHLNTTDPDNIKTIAITSGNIANTGYHWHIDRLLRIATAFTAIYAGSGYRTECLIIDCLKEHGFRVISGFGSTDCRSGCGGHLVYLFEADIKESKNVAIHGFKHLNLKPIVGNTYVRELS